MPIDVTQERVAEALEVLGLSMDGLTKSSIAKKYRNESLSVHPDKNSTPKATSAFQGLTTAREVLERFVDNNYTYDDAATAVISEELSEERELFDKLLSLSEKTMSLQGPIISEEFIEFVNRNNDRYPSFIEMITNGYLSFVVDHTDLIGNMPFYNGGHFSYTIIRDRYELALLSELDENQPIKQDVLYIKKFNNEIKYRILRRDNQVHEGTIKQTDFFDVNAEQFNKLDNENIDNYRVIKAKIFAITSKRGHTHPNTIIYKVIGHDAGWNVLFQLIVTSLKSKLFDKNWPYLLQLFNAVLKHEIQLPEYKLFSVMGKFLSLYDYFYCEYKSNKLTLEQLMTIHQALLVKQQQLWVTLQLNQIFNELVVKYDDYSQIDLEFARGDRHSDQDSFRNRMHDIANATLMIVSLAADNPRAHPERYPAFFNVYEIAVLGFYCLMEYPEMYPGHRGNDLRFQESALSVFIKDDFINELAIKSLYPIYEKINALKGYELLLMEDDKPLLAPDKIYIRVNEGTIEYRSNNMQQKDFITETDLGHPIPDNFEGLKQIQLNIFNIVSKRDQAHLLKRQPLTEVNREKAKILGEVFSTFPSTFIQMKKQKQIAQFTPANTRQLVRDSFAHTINTAISKATVSKQASDILFCLKCALGTLLCLSIVGIPVTISLYKKGFFKTNTFNTLHESEETVAAAPKLGA